MKIERELPNYKSKSHTEGIPHDYWRTFLTEAIYKIICVSGSRDDFKQHEIHSPLFYFKRR